MIASAYFLASRRPKAAALLMSMSMSTSLAATLAGCSPYPDDGEFLAGVVYSANFIAGVKNLSQTGAVGRGTARNEIYPYTVISTTSADRGGLTLSSSTAAVSAFWTNGGKRQPLDRKNAQQVYVFDSGCAAPRDYQYDDRLDLIRRDEQYPLFLDIPEVLSTNAGRPGRVGTGAYSAIVEIIHLSGPGNIPCQSIKRFDTAKARIGERGDLHEGRHEYRLFQVFDPAIAMPPLPYKLGFYNQLVVPYIDMGPVPLEDDGQTFRTMPLYRVKISASKTETVVFGLPSEAGSDYSPICRDYNLTLQSGMMLPLDATDPLLKKMALKTENLASCLVCRTLPPAGDGSTQFDCPFVTTEGMP